MAVQSDSVALSSVAEVLRGGPAQREGHGHLGFGHILAFVSLLLKRQCEPSGDSLGVDVEVIQTPVGTFYVGNHE